MTTIPLIDLDAWYRGAADERTAFAADVDAHLRRLGFLVVTNHGISRAVIDECRAATRSFFHQPDHTKRPLSLSDDAYRGWVGAGLESNAATYGVDTPPDLKETYAYGPVDVPDPGLTERAPRWFAPNRWPATPEEFQPAAEAWWRAARRLADDLLEIFAVALGMEPDHFVERSSATTASVSLNWYWPRSHLPPEPGQYRIGPHTDFGTLTILDREPGAGGLQVLDEDQTWIDAPIVDDALIINLGDMFSRWTNDRWRSNEHRVLAPPAHEPNEELISLIFFHEPNHDAIVDPLPTCVSDTSPAKYPPISANDYLAAKMDALSVT
ncbi:MAG: 2-oxoglutarate and iron-dependent oxygenase domain-containing protein [Actinomycetota bacterium]